jgi:hypothetical protein
LTNHSSCGCSNLVLRYKRNTGRHVEYFTSRFYFDITTLQYIFFLRIFCNFTSVNKYLQVTLNYLKATN